MKHKLINGSYKVLKYKLYDLNKRGTIILAGPRYGSHYLANVIMHALPEACKPSLWPDSHSELGISDRGYMDVHQELDTMLSDSGYQIAIVNDQNAKMLMLSEPALFEDWHIVRIVHNDKIRWFRSFWYFITVNKEEFLHSGTEKTVYEQHRVDQGPYRVSVSQLNNIFGGLTQTVINQYIAVDEHVNYEDLAQLPNPNPWRANQYPDTPLIEMFERGAEFAALLTNWPREVLSPIRNIKKSSWIVDIKEDANGDLILPLPEDMMAQVGWTEGDSLDWIDREDGTWELRKKEQSAHGEC